jgi:16S rRNA (uracil1498-N3)-methyltransferase
MQRYFVEQINIQEKRAVLLPSDAYHVQKVMRMQVKDSVIVCHETEGTFLGKLIKLTPNEAIVELNGKIEEYNELPLDVTIAHGLVRREKMEFVIESCVALGAKAYIPIFMNRSTAKWQEEKGEKKEARINKIIKEASEQSHRNRLMKFIKPLTIPELIKEKANFDLCLFAYEDSPTDDVNLKKHLSIDNMKSLLVLFGPEGGFDEKEVEILTEAGFIPITLGKRILRTELAPLLLLSAIVYQKELKA